MSGFTLDTSGTVGERVTGDMYRRGYALGPLKGRALSWDDLTPFQQGCAKAALRSAQLAIWANPTKHGSFTRVGFRHLAPETLARIIADCERFAATFDMTRLAGRESDAGRAFWVTRNRIFGGTVAGSFYDAEWNAGLEGDHLALVAKTFPPLTPYFGDYGHVYLREGDPA
jgi:hypothetical protein